MGIFEIVKDNKDEIKDALPEAIERALEAVGLQAESYAKMKCPVDTGLLRNSITHAIGGKPAAIKAYHADSAKGGAQSVGFYTGSAPGEKDTVYIGTNVEYAPYVEMGHMLPSGETVPGEHFLKQAIESHKTQYKKLAEQALKGF